MKSPSHILIAAADKIRKRYLQDENKTSSSSDFDSEDMSSKPTVSSAHKSREFSDDGASHFANRKTLVESEYTSEAQTKGNNNKASPPFEAAESPTPFNDVLKECGSKNKSSKINNESTSQVEEQPELSKDTAAVAAVEESCSKVKSKNELLLHQCSQNINLRHSDLNPHQQKGIINSNNNNKLKQLSLNSLSHIPMEEKQSKSRGRLGSFKTPKQSRQSESHKKSNVNVNTRSLRRCAQNKAYKEPSIRR